MPFVAPSAPCRCRPMSFPRKMACLRTSNVAPGTKAAPDQHAKIRRDMVRMRRLLMVEGGRPMREMLVSYFTKQIEAFVQAALFRAGKRVNITGRKASYDFDFGGAGDFDEIWAAALRDVLGTAADIELVSRYTPIAQSVAARAYERTAIFIGDIPGSAPAPAPTPSLNILRRTQVMAEKVTNINETTRVRLAETIVKAREEGATVAEVAKQIREKVPEIALNRVPTIVRTEVGNAVDQGTIQALKESKTVQTADVIGCKARESSSPTYNGFSTCNITGVPVYDLDKLLFHPNHTGCIVAGAFIGEDKPSVG